MKKYLTEYIDKDDDCAGSYVYANSWEEAQENADLLEEGRVIGKLICRITEKDINERDL